MLVEGRNHPFPVNRLAQSKTIAFASSDLLPPSPSIQSPSLEDINCENSFNFCSPEKEIPLPPTIEPQSFSKRIYSKLLAIINLKTSSLLIFIAYIILFIILISSSNPESSTTSTTSLLLFSITITIIIIVFAITYLLHRRTFLLASSSSGLSLLLIFYNNCYHYCYRFVKQYFINQPSSSSKSTSRKTTIIHSLLKKFILFAMVSLVLTSSSVQDSMKEEVAIVKAASTSASFVPSQKNIKHSNVQSNYVPKVESFTSEQLKQVELLFLRIIGLDTRPKPELKHKIPDYIIDLYRWFNDGDTNHEDDNEDEEYDDDDGGDHTPPNSLLGLTTDDLFEVNQNQLEPFKQQDHDDDQIRKHHRVSRTRRSTQSSRVTLKGPSNTVISHKSFHSDGHYGIRFRRSVNNNDDIDLKQSSTSSLNQKKATIAQLKFDIHLPKDESLTGAELRLYRHSYYESKNHPQPDTSSTSSPSSSFSSSSSSSSSLIRRRRILSKHNNFWPLYHWSVRYRIRQSNDSLLDEDDTPHHPHHTTTITTFDNSHPSKVVLQEQEEESSSSSSSHLIPPNTSTSSSSSSSSGEKYSSSSINQHTSDGGDDHHHPHYFLQRVNIYHLLRPLNDDEEEHYGPEFNDKLLHKWSKLIDTQVIDIRDSGWLSFDVFPAVEWWLKHPKENYGLIVTLKDLNGRIDSSHSHLFVFKPDTETNPVQSKSQPKQQQEQEEVEEEEKIDHQQQWHEVQPLIITFSNDIHTHQFNMINREKLLNRSKRERKMGGGSGGGGGGGGGNSYSSQQRQRSNRNKKQHKTSSRRRDFCRRHQMYVDFKEIGWTDWIVAPPGYQAYYCKGECSYPMSQNVNKTNHAIIQALINSVNPATVPEPCCIPSDLSPITLLYIDQHDKVVLKSYPNMKVEGCGCS